MRCPEKFTGIKACFPVTSGSGFRNQQAHRNGRIFIGESIVRNHLLIVPVVEIEEFGILEIYGAEKLFVRVAIAGLQILHELFLNPITEFCEVLLVSCEESATEGTATELEIFGEILNGLLRQIVNVGR